MKKQRDRQRLYTVEGSKMILDLIKGAEYTDHRLSRLFATDNWISEHATLLKPFTERVVSCGENELRKISHLVTPQPVICVVEMPEKSDREKDGRGPQVPDGPVLVFESIRDPGNLGTIMRTANWFGISHLVCSPDSVDQFNPKVVQATMGAIFHVSVHYLNLEDWLAEMVTEKRSIYGTFLEGNNIFESPLGDQPVILFGNESRGLSNRYDPYLQGKLAVPSFYRDRLGPESLNVASTVAVVCSEIRRSSHPPPTRSGN
jgi:TrmH family RNA methyltransferase